MVAQQLHFIRPISFSRLNSCIVGTIPIADPTPCFSSSSLRTPVSFNPLWYTRFLNEVIVGERNVFQNVEEGAGKPPPSVLVLHARFGGCIEDLPSYDAFTLGGPYSVRNYNMGALGAATNVLEVATELRISVKHTHACVFAMSSTNSRPLSSAILLCLQRTLKEAMTIISYLFSIVSSDASKLSILSYGTAISLIYRPRLLFCEDDGVGLDDLGPAVLHELEMSINDRLKYLSLSSLDPRGRGSFSGGGIVMALVVKEGEEDVMAFEVKEGEEEIMDSTNLVVVVFLLNTFLALFIFLVFQV